MDKLLVLIIAFTLLSWGCGSSKQTSETTDVASSEDQLTLLHDIWVAQQIQGEPILADHPAPRLEIHPAEGRISGNGSCNNIFGQCTATETTLTFGQIGSTKMYCRPTIKQEQRFLETLALVDSYQIKNLQLILMQAGKEVMLLHKVD